MLYSTLFAVVMSFRRLPLFIAQDGGNSRGHPNQMKGQMGEERRRISGIFNNGLKSEGKEMVID